MRYLLFGSLREQKRRARDVDLVVELEPGETVDQAMLGIAAIGPRVRKPIELALVQRVGAQPGRQLRPPERPLGVLAAARPAGLLRGAGAGHARPGGLAVAG